MLIALFCICLVMAIIGTIVCLCNDRWGDCAILAIVTTVCYMGLVVSIIAIAIVSTSVRKLTVIDDKIAMYQEENKVIEQQIATVVEQYQYYEKEVFKNSTTASAVTLVSLYPELKSDKLVSKQLDAYVKNNNKIKKLKAEKIDGTVLRWWLYFGK